MCNDNSYALSDGRNEKQGVVLSGVSFITAPNNGLFFMADLEIILEPIYWLTISDLSDAIEIALPDSYSRTFAMSPELSEAFKAK